MITDKIYLYENKCKPQLFINYKYVGDAWGYFELDNKYTEIKGYIKYPKNTKCYVYIENIPVSLEKNKIYKIHLKHPESNNTRWLFPKSQYEGEEDGYHKFLAHFNKKTKCWGKYFCGNINKRA